MSDFFTLNEFIAIASKSKPTLLSFKDGGSWNHFSIKDLFEKSLFFAAGLKELGFQKNQTLAIYSYQNPTWLIVDFGAILAGGATVPIFHNISKENLIYELKDSDVKYIFTDSKDFLDMDFEGRIISYGFNSDKAISIESLILLGKTAFNKKKYDEDFFVKSAKEDDLATIIYTSGSTGKPKGVELTHRNLASQIKGISQIFPLDKNTDKALSFLPLAHIFERVVMMFYISQGIKIYFVDDIKNLGNFLQEVNPTLITAVPRVLEKLFAKIKEKVDTLPFYLKFLTGLALRRATTLDPDVVKNHIDYAIYKLLDAIFYKKFRSVLGSEIKMIICGGAPILVDLERFYKNIGIDLFCGYGMTESAPVLAVNYKNVNKTGTVGRRFSSVELAIASDGELLARGENIMRGYHNDEKKTKETIVEGWLKTGDLANIDLEGFVKIIGRKKELFKNSYGKYVNPIFIEQKLMQSLPFLMGAIIVAEGRNFTSALLFPDFEMIKNLKIKLDYEGGSDEEFLHSRILYDFVLKKIKNINIKLDNWEQIKKFTIIARPISTSTGEITPSMKLKRNILEEKFKNAIDEFYK
jgi:long-chain acyl-CoA synthetase